MTRRRFVVQGVVQGVNFRANTVREATRLGVSGRVWNRSDGGVELIAEGDAAAVAALERWLEEGPRGARVSGVVRADLGGDRRYDGFNIAWSAPRED